MPGPGPIDFEALTLGPAMAAFGEKRRPLYRPDSGAPPFEVDGIFDRHATVVGEGPDGMPVAERMAVLGVRAGQFPADPVQNDQVDIWSAGCRYIVRDAQPDGLGGWKLLLNVAPRA